MAAWGLAALCAHAGCAATVAHRDGRVIEGRITGGDRQTLALASATGEPITLDRADIVDIDHPGDVAMLVGLPLAMVGVGVVIGGFAIADAPPPDDPAEAESAAETVLTGVALLAPTIAGAAVYIESWVRARRPDGPQPRVQIAPGGVRVRF